MSQYGLLSRSALSSHSSSRTSTPLTGISSPSTISVESLEVPDLLYIRDVKVDLKSVRGTGSYGTVFVGTWHNSKVAAKKLHSVFFEQLVTSESKTGILRSFAREVNMLTQLKHPNIVQFYGLYSARPGSELNPDTYLVQELMHCSLESRIRQTPPLTFRNMLDVALDIIGGLRYLHERAEPIIHRDLASKNILLTSVGVAKIADLGVAKILDENRSTPQSRQPGTELYMPPEVKIEGMAYDTRVDIYSFGVVVLEMAIGRDAKANEAFRVNANNSIVLTPEVERRKTDFDTLGHHPLRSVILNCLGKRDERPTAKYLSEQVNSMCTSQLYRECIPTPIIVDTKATELPGSSKITAEKIRNLQRENERLQARLKSPKQRRSIEHQLDELVAENASLQSQLMKKEAQITRMRESLNFGPTGDEVSQLRKTAEALRVQNDHLKQRLQEGGSMSLPEQMPSYSSDREVSLSSQISLSADQLPTLKELSISSTKDQESQELKRLRKQLDKYKSVNIEMDQKLKEARLELKKHDGRAELSYRLELDQVRAECDQLRSQLDISMRENSYLQSQLGAALANAKIY